MDTCRPTNCTQTPQNQPPHTTTNTQPATKTTKQPTHSPPTRPQNDRTEQQDPNRTWQPSCSAPQGHHQSLLSHISVTLTHSSVTSQSPLSHPQSRLSHSSVTPQSPLRRESAVGCHADQPTPTMRAFRHTPMPRKAHLSCLQTTLTPLTTLSLLGHPLTPVKKSFALGQCRPRNRGFSWTATHFYTSRPRFRPFSWMGTGRVWVSIRPSTY